MESSSSEMESTTVTQMKLQLLNYFYEKQILCRVKSQINCWLQFKIEHNVDISLRELIWTFFFDILRNLPDYADDLTRYQMKYFAEFAIANKYITQVNIEQLFIQEGEDFIYVDNPDRLREINHNLLPDSGNRRLVIEEHATRTTGRENLFKIPDFLVSVFNAFLLTPEEQLKEIRISDDELRKRLRSYLSVHGKLPSWDLIDWHDDDDTQVFASNVEDSILPLFSSTLITDASVRKRQKSAQASGIKPAGREVVEPGNVRRSFIMSSSSESEVSATISEPKKGTVRRDRRALDELKKRIKGKGAEHRPDALRKPSKKLPQKKTGQIKRQLSFSESRRRFSN